MYIYDGTILKWNYKKLVSANRGYGLRKATSYI